MDSMDEEGLGGQEQPQAQGTLLVLCVVAGAMLWVVVVFCMLNPVKAGHGGFGWAAALLLRQLIITVVSGTTLFLSAVALWGALRYRRCEWWCILILLSTIGSGGFWFVQSLIVFSRVL